ncbi:hypothetical protein EYF80_002553 [Liparis tanakae]|uniref:Uncharacterized protein n=1 Tax=Liparis tanakae TaxID=230148 RepID=A0A4Z2JDK4_9TELE|nr:hypothetical protein EYF80_002553 [Liparis tanakae]
MFSSELHGSCSFSSFSSFSSFFTSFFSSRSSSAVRTSTSCRCLRYSSSPSPDTVDSSWSLLDMTCPQGLCSIRVLWVSAGSGSSESLQDLGPRGLCRIRVLGVSAGSGSSGSLQDQGPQGLCGIRVLRVSAASGSSGSLQHQGPCRIRVLRVSAASGSSGSLQDLGPQGLCGIRVLRVSAASGSSGSLQHQGPQGLCSIRVLRHQDLEGLQEKQWTQIQTQTLRLVSKARAINRWFPGPKCIRRVRLQGSPSIPRAAAGSVPVTKEQRVSVSCVLLPLLSLLRLTDRSPEAPPPPRGCRLWLKTHLQPGSSVQQCVLIGAEEVMTFDLSFTKGVKVLEDDKEYSESRVIIL